MKNLEKSDVRSHNKVR